MLPKQRKNVAILPLKIEQSFNFQIWKEDNWKHNSIPTKHEMKILLSDNDAIVTNMIRELLYIYMKKYVSKNINYLVFWNNFETTRIEITLLLLELFESVQKIWSKIQSQILQIIFTIHYYNYCLAFVSETFLYFSHWYTLYSVKIIGYVIV